MLDTVLHRWLRIPYVLNVRHLKRPKKPRATLLFVHGLGNTGNAWDEVIKKLPKDIRVISIDLLGFGDSPSPSWAMYDAKTQARSVLATLVKLRIATPLIIVGHSMGSLVAIEVAKRYPLVIDRLILCSPPLYDNRKQKLLRTDDLLRQLYKIAEQNTDKFVQLAAFVMKYKLINQTFNVTEDNVDSYMAALSAMIINQDSLQDAYAISVPTTILHGALDPFVITKNLTRLGRANPNITLKRVMSGHEIKGLFVGAVSRTIIKQLDISSSGKK